MTDKILFISDVMRKTHLTRQTIHNYVRDGKFPKPSKIGNKNAWYESSINEWIEVQMDD